MNADFGVHLAADFEFIRTPPMNHCQTVNDDEDCDGGNDVQNFWSKNQQDTRWHFLNEI